MRSGTRQAFVIRHGSTTGWPSSQEVRTAGQARSGTLNSGGDNAPVGRCEDATGRRHGHRRGDGHRRGSTLIVVVGMLGLLLLLGFTFFTFANQENTSSEFFSEAAKEAETISSEVLFDYGLEQVLLGARTDRPNSVLYSGAPLGRHSLVVNMLGNDIAPFTGEGVNVVHRDYGRDTDADGNVGRTRARHRLEARIATPGARARGRPRSASLGSNPPHPGAGRPGWHHGPGPTPEHGHRGSSNGHRAPDTKDPAPGTTHRAPSTKHQAPGVAYRASAIAHRHKYRHLAPAGHLAPATGYRAPATGHSTPDTGHRTPGTGHRAPGTAAPLGASSHQASARTRARRPAVSGSVARCPPAEPRDEGCAQRSGAAQATAASRGRSAAGSGSLRT